MNLLIGLVVVTLVSIIITAVTLTVSEIQTMIIKSRLGTRRRE